MDEEMEEEINYRYLRKIQEMEKKSPTLTEIHSGFYINLHVYLKQLEERFEKEESSQKKMLLSNEIENTKKIATNIYEQRERKIILTAVSKARGGNPELKNLIDVEKTLFSSILDLMIKSRESILNKKKPSKIKDTTNEAELEKNNDENEQKDTNPIVVVSKDILEFVGTDEKKYSLKKGDVLSLPKDMVDMLSKRNAIQIIEQQQSQM